jgi:hypothetical protein
MISKPTYGHRNAQNQLICHVLISFQDYPVNCKWKDNIASLHVSDGFICIFDNAIDYYYNIYVCMYK